MSEYTIRTPVPHEKQRLFLDSAAKRKVIVAGRRGGKTTGVSIMAADMAMAGRRVLEAAPVATQTDAFWDAVRTYFAEPIAAGVVRKNETNRLLELPNGGRIRCKTAYDADTLRGDYADVLILDEYQHMDPNAWDKVGAPMLLDNNGDAVFIGTPERRNHFYITYNRAVADDTGRWSAWHFTSHDNPHLSASALEEITQDMTAEAYKQEILAEFLEGAGSVFRNIGACTHAPLASVGQHAGHHIVAGVDWGKQGDFTCVSVGCADCHVEIARDRFNQIDYVLQRARLTALCEQWQPASILAESNSMGDPILEVLLREGLPVRPFQTTASTKPPLIENLALALERTEWQFQADPIWTAELEAYERTVSPATGRSAYSAPSGMHDDCLPQGTLIRTMSGYTPIEDISVGDMVLTHLGRYRPVEACIQKPFDGQFYTVKSRCNPELSLSYNHPLYAAKHEYTHDVKGPASIREWVLPESWKRSYRTICVMPPLGEPDGGVLTEHDFYANGKSATNIGLRELLLDERFASFLGRFVADGHCRKHGVYGMELAFDDTDIGEAEPYEAYLEDLGIAVRRERFHGKQHGFKLVFSSKLLWHVLQGTYDATRERVLPTWSWRLGVLLRHTVDAWCQADGWAVRGYRIGCTTSLALALTMRDLAMATGRYASIQKLTNLSRFGRKVKDQYWVAIHDDWGVTRHQRLLSDFEYGARADIEPYHYKGEVFNLQVAEDRSFVANGIVVHNCVMARALMVWQAMHDVSDGLSAGEFVGMFRHW